MSSKQKFMPRFAVLLLACLSATSVTYAEPWQDLAAPPLGPRSISTLSGAFVKLGGVNQLLQDGENVYAATRSGLYRRSVDGSSWESVSLPISYPISSVGASTSHILIVPEWIYATVDPGDKLFVLNKASGQVTQSTSPLKQPNGSSISACRSGKSVGAGNTLILASSCHKAPGQVGGPDESALIKSMDGGLTWSSIAPQGLITAANVSTLDGALIYLLGDTDSDRSLYRSVDGGASWSTLQSLPYGVKIFQKSSDEFFITNQINILWTNDAGENLNVMPLGLCICTRNCPTFASKSDPLSFA